MIFCLHIIYWQPTPASCRCLLWFKRTDISQISLNMRNLLQKHKTLKIHQFLPNLLLKQLFKILISSCRNYLIAIFSAKIKVIYCKNISEFLDHWYIFMWLVTLKNILDLMCTENIWCVPVNNLEWLFKKVSKFISKSLFNISILNLGAVDIEYHARMQRIVN